MITLTKRYVSILFLFIANALDAMLTDFGIREGAIMEANPLMERVYDLSPSLFMLLKLALPLLLIPLLAKPISPSLQRLLSAACVVYILILGLHGIWLLEQFNPI